MARQSFVLLDGKRLPLMTRLWWSFPVRHWVMCVYCRVRYGFWPWNY